MLLVWNFEPFRSFLSFEVLQQAAATLLMFDGLMYREDPSETTRLGAWLNERTGIEWLPKRKVPEGVVFDPEGSVFRNKARVLTSMGLIDPSEFESKRRIVTTEFCRRLGCGLVGEVEFYVHVINEFRYPHDAYPREGRNWEAASTSVQPFVLLIRLLMRLAEVDYSEAYLTSDEFVGVVMKAEPTFDLDSIEKEVLALRKTGMKPETSDIGTDTRRYASDIYGYLCLTGITYYRGASRIDLNLISRSNIDRTYFFAKNNKGESALDRLNSLFPDNRDLVNAIDE
jgi:hypothetical protein